MKKIPCLFERDFTARGRFTLLETLTPGCEWVLAGEGRATRKWDGTACLAQGGVLYKRLDCKKDKKTGAYKPPPPGAIPCTEPDPVTGHWPHWIPVGDEPDSKWHRLALEERASDLGGIEDGTYELCGPAVNGNAEGLERHVLLRHGADTVQLPSLIPSCSSAWMHATLRAALEGRMIEGIVFHHPDGRMCKIRRADFGLPWNAKK